MDACARCGAFGELRELDGARYCVTCAARPDIGIVSRYRALRLGRRDVWAWIVGGSALLSVLMVFFTIAWALPLAATWATLAVTQVLFCVGFGWARPLPLITMGVAAGVFALTKLASPLALVWPAILAVSAYRDLRCRLFFRKDVSDDELRPVVQRLQNNDLSYTANVLAGVSLFFPPIWLAAVG